VRFVLSTPVAAPLDTVFRVFGEASFVEELVPRVMGLRVVRIGLEVGDEIEARFSGLGPRAPWVSRIVSLDRADAAIWYIDESVRTPFPFASFRHRHGFVGHEAGTLLVDDVTFETRPAFLGPLVLPLVRVSFAYRRGPYRRRFGAG
jgi:ligand-binding SRPBCC domain-containing protein